MDLPYQIDYNVNNNVLDELHKKFIDKTCILLYIHLYFEQYRQSIKTYFRNQYVQWFNLAIYDHFCFAKKILPELSIFQFREMFNLHINMILTQNSYINDDTIVSLSRQIIQMLLFNPSESMLLYNSSESVTTSVTTGTSMTTSIFYFTNKKLNK